MSQYKRYIYRNGRKFGPYYYSNKKVEGKVISTYLGTDEPKSFGKKPSFSFSPNTRKIAIFTLSVTSIALLIYLIFILKLFSTGNVPRELSELTIPIDEGPEVIAQDNTTEGNATVVIVPGNLTEVNISKNVTPTKPIEPSPVGVSINTIQTPAVIGQPVEWIKEVDLDKLGEVKIQIPAQAENIIIFEILANGQRQEVISEKIRITGQIVSDSDSSEEDSFIINLFKKIASFFTGKTVDVASEGGFKEITISATSLKYEIRYETPAPYTIEQQSERGKTITVVGQENIEYKDVLVSTNIDESLNINNENKLRVYWVEQNKYVDFNSFDSDNSGLIDKIEWQVERLSNQTFEIIVITKAEHLDLNRKFLSDIYNEVFELDGVWSETIPDSHYVRVTFEQKLTSSNDITIYPRIISGDPIIQVYEVNQDNLITEFTSLNSNDYNQVFLTDLVGEQDTFDLRVSGGSVEIDHVVDPVAAPGGAIDLRAQQCRENNQYDINSINPPFQDLCQGVYPSICGSFGDRLSCDDNIVETATNSKAGRTTTYAGVRINSSNNSITNCNSITSVFLCYEFWCSGCNAVQHSCEVAVDNDQGASYSITSVTCSSSAPGFTCIDVTANDNWQCSDFFGLNPTGAIAYSQALKTGASGTDTWNFDVLYFNVTYTETSTNQPPAIPFVASIPPQFPLETTTRAVVFNVHVFDSNGFGDINTSSVKANFTMSGEPTRYGNCILQNNIDANTQNYSCSVGMWYYDKNGTWSVSVNTSDLSGTIAINDTITFEYLTLKAMVITSPVGSLSWPTLNPGATNQTSTNDPNVINNTGNYEGPILITGYNLIGQSIPSEFIDVGNFTAGLTSGNDECIATQLQNSTAISITGSNLPRGPTISTENIYYCIPLVPFVSSQNYTATGINSWTISI